MSTHENSARARAQTGALRRIASTRLPDLRDFSLAAAILRDVRIHRVRLLTNNPHKVRALRDNGIEIVERLPCEVDPTAYTLVLPAECPA